MTKQKKASKMMNRFLASRSLPIFSQKVMVSSNGGKTMHRKVQVKEPTSEM